MLRQQTHVLHGRRLSTAGKTEAKFHTTAPCCSLRRVIVAVVADLPDQSKSGVGLVAPGKVGYTGRYVSMGTPHSSPFSILLGTQLAGEAFCSFPPGRS